MEFDPTSYTVSESGRFANITVVKRGQTTLEARVEFTTADDTAIGESWQTFNDVSTLFLTCPDSFCSWRRLHNNFTDSDISANRDFIDCDGTNPD